MTVLDIFLVQNVMKNESDDELEQTSEEEEVEVAEPVKVKKVKGQKALSFAKQTTMNAKKDYEEKKKDFKRESQIELMNKKMTQAVKKEIRPKPARIEVPEEAPKSVHTHR